MDQKWCTLDIQLLKSAYCRRYLLTNKNISVCQDERMQLYRVRMLAISVPLYLSECKIERKMIVVGK